MPGPNSNLNNGQELVRIPVGNDVPWYFFRIGLSGAQYKLTFRYNVRMTRWIMDIADAEGNPVQLGAPMLLSRDLTGRFIGTLAVPVGTFSVTDDTNQGVEATRYSFGVDHSLYYLDPLAVT